MKKKKNGNELNKVNEILKNKWLKTNSGRSVWQKISELTNMFKLLIIVMKRPSALEASIETTFGVTNIKVT